MPDQSIIRCDFSNKRVQPMAHSIDPKLLCVLEGTLRLTEDNSERGLAAGDFYLVNSGQGFGWKADRGLLACIITINYSLLSELYEGRPMFFRCDSAGMAADLAEALRNILNRLMTYNHANDGDGRLLFYSYGYRLIHMLCTSCISDYNAGAWNYPVKGTVNRPYEILNYVCENYMYPISLTSLAEQFNLTTTYLSRFFKTKLHANFMTVLHNIRLEHALNDLLYTTKSMTSIAMDNGFPNSASFINTFRETYHTTPSNYRKEYLSSKTDKSGQDSGAEADQDEAVQIHSQVARYLEGVSVPEEVSSPSVYSRVSMRCSSRESENRQIKKPWRRLLNVGTATSLLRFDAREQIRTLCEELRFEYIYINNLHSPGMKIVPEDGAVNFNFSEIQRMLDYVIALGCHPYIELEAQEEEPIRRMDSNILNASVKSRLEEVSENSAFINNLLSFLLGRYGIEEMSQWYISIERSTAKNNMVSEDAYFRYFSAIYRAVKERVPRIKVGGPGFTVDFSEGRLESFLRTWTEAGVKPDFINLYVFPYVFDEYSLKAGHNNASTDRFFLSAALGNLGHVKKRLGLTEIETHVTMWNFSLTNRNVLNDSCFKAAYIMNSLIRSWDDCDLLGYWNTIDISTMNSDTIHPLFGGNGILSQSGIKKPAFFAFYFLNRLLPHWLAQIDNAIITTDGNGSFTICCHNYKHFSYQYYRIAEEELKVEDQSNVFEDNEKLDLSIEITDLPDREYLIRKRFVNWTTGNIQASWTEFGQYESFNNLGMNYLRAQSEPGLQYRKAFAKDGVLSIEETLEPQEIMMIEIGPLKYAGQNTMYN